MHTFKLKDRVDKPTKKSSGRHADLKEYKEWLNNNTEFEIAFISPSGEIVGVEGLQTKTEWEHLASDLTPKSEVFKVRVVKVSKDSYWYVGKEGKEFEVTNSRFGDCYMLAGDTSSLVYKSDCIVVTDQKFKEKDRVKQTCTMGVHPGTVEKYDPKREPHPYYVSWDSGGTAWTKESGIELLEEPTSHPFTEELFNQGKKVNMPIRETLLLTESVAVTIWRNSDFTECHYDVSTYRIDVNDHNKKHHNVIASFKSLFDFTEYLNAKIKHLNSF